MTPRRAALYLRVSTVDQAEKSIPAQEAACRELAATRGYDVTHVFRDEGISASKPDVARPGFDAMRKAAEEGAFEVLIAWDTDRLTRQMGSASLLGLRWHLEELGVAIITVNQPTMSQADDEMADMRDLIRSRTAYEEARRKSERAKLGNQRRIERGQYVGREPFGYVTEGGTMRPDQDTGREVQWIFDQWNSGTSQREIARQLTKRGVPTKTARRSARKGSTKSQWHQATVRQILVNPTYLGKVVHHGEIYDGVHEALVTEEAFTTAARRLAQRRQAEGTSGGAAVSRKRQDGRGAHSGRQAKHHLLSRLLRCGECGEAMNARIGDLRKDGTRYMTYQCRRANGQLPGPACSMRPIERGAIDRAVMEHFQDKLIDIEAIQAQLGELHDHDLARLNAAAAAARKRSEEAERNFNSAREKVVLGFLDGEDLSHFRDVRDKAREAARAADKEAQTARDNPPVSDLDRNVAERLHKIREAIGGALDEIDTATLEDIASARAALQATFDEFRVYSGDVSPPPFGLREDHPAALLFPSGVADPEEMQQFVDQAGWDVLPAGSEMPRKASERPDPEGMITIGALDEPIRWSVVPYLKDEVIESWGLDGQANVPGLPIRLSDAGLVGGTAKGAAGL